MIRRHPVPSGTRPAREAAAGPYLDLYYVSGGQYRPLPAWARLFLALGCSLACADEPHARLVAGLVVPVRTYAAALTAFGAVAARAYRSDPAEDIAAHFAQLCSLPPGTPVAIRTDGRAKKGELVGGEERGGTPGVRVRIGPGEERWLPWQESQRIQLSRRPATGLPQRQRGRALPSGTGFLQHVLRDCDVRRYILASKLECIIAGSPGLLRDEITQKHFAIPAGTSDFERGSLQDVLRVKQFLEDGEAYRTEITTVQVRLSEPALAESAAPPVVVFDGALGFLKWRSRWPRSNLAVVVARTDPRFLEGVQELNRPVSFNSCAVLKALPAVDAILDIPALPEGVELMVYREEIG